MPGLIGRDSLFTDFRDHLNTDCNAVYKGEHVIFSAVVWIIDPMVQGQCFRVASLILKKNLLIICPPEGQRDNHHRYLKDIHITQQTRTKGGPHYDWSVLSTYSLYFRKLLCSIAILHFVSIMGLVSVKWTLSLCKATQCNDLILQSIKGCTVDPTEYILNYDIYSWILSREGFYPRPVMALRYCHRLRLSVCVSVCVCVCPSIISLSGR